jgi:DNA polymerase-3 subunit delta
MTGDMRPESIIESLEKGHLALFYLFYGPGEFRTEKLLEKIKASFIPEPVRDLNLEFFYGGETPASEVIQRSRSMPFLAKSRLIIVRRVEEFSKEQLEKFIPYLENPSESTCVIFLSQQTDFKRGFYKAIKAAGLAVKFDALRQDRVADWIKQTARDLGLELDEDACDYLERIVGNNPRELYSELEKLRLTFTSVSGVDQIKAFVISGRIYSIFELVDRVSSKKCADSLEALGRYLQEEDKRVAPLQVIGMLNWQIRLLWQTKSVLAKGGGFAQVAEKLSRNRFKAGDLMNQAERWSLEELERGLHLLYEADGWLKSGSRPKPVLERVVISLCS